MARLVFVSLFFLVRALLWLLGAALLTILLIFAITIKEQPEVSLTQRFSHAVEAEQGLIDARILDDPRGAQLLIAADPRCSSALTRWAINPAYFCP